MAGLVPATFHLEILLGSNLEGAQARRLVDQQITGTFGVHGLAKSEALRVFAPELVELDRIGVRFSAFGYDFHAEIMRERDDRAQDHRPRSARRGPDERLIDLDRVEREALQVSKRGMAGPEVVEREACAELLDAGQNLRCVLRIFHDQRLGNLELESAPGERGAA